MTKGTKTTREIEHQKNINVFWFAILLAVAIAVFISIFIIEYRINQIQIEKPQQPTYDYKCFLPLEDGNYTIVDGILKTQSGRLIKCEELKWK